MDSNAYEHGPKGKMIFSPNHKVLQGIIIENPVINPLTGRSFPVNLLVL